MGVGGIGVDSVDNGWVDWESQDEPDTVAETMPVTIF